MAPPGPNIGLGVFVFRSPSDLRFVFGKRKGSLGAGSYSLTGGHLEVGETFEKGAKREVLEETGLVVGRVSFITAVENFFEEKGEKKHYVTLFVAGFVEEGTGVEAKNLEPEKCEGWEWWTIKQLREKYQTDPEALFLPMRNLFEQRPEMARKMEQGDIFQ